MYPYVLRDTSRDNFPQLSASRLAADGCLCPQPLLGGDFFGGFPLQLSFDLPATPEHALENLLVQGLSDASSGIETGPFDGALWADVLVLVLCLLLSTPRDIKRYLAALPAGLRMIGEEVALVDVLALEAIRLRLPEVFAMLGPMSHALTDVGMITSQAPGWQAVGRSGAGVSSVPGVVPVADGAPGDGIDVCGMVQMPVSGSQATSVSAVRMVSSAGFTAGLLW